MSFIVPTKDISLLFKSPDVNAILCTYLIRLIIAYKCSKALELNLCSSCGWTGIFFLEILSNGNFGVKCTSIVVFRTNKKTLPVSLYKLFWIIYICDQVLISRNAINKVICGKQQFSVFYLYINKILIFFNSRNKNNCSMDMFRDKHEHWIYNI